MNDTHVTPNTTLRSLVVYSVGTTVILVPVAFFSSEQFLLCLSVVLIAAFIFSIESKEPLKMFGALVGIAIGSFWYLA